MSKIIEYGLPKTGTKSLTKALTILGFKNSGWNPELMSYFKESSINIKNFKNTKLFKEMQNFESFTDGPWHNINFNIIDFHFPNSKYIYMFRSDKSWVESMERHFSPKYIKNKNTKWAQTEWITCRDLHIKNLLQRKHAREKLFKKYKKIHPNRFLITCWQEGWEKLCPFLEKSTPTINFPHIK